MRAAVALLVLVAAAGAAAGAKPLPLLGKGPYAIGHRGLCGVYPEHTAKGYEAAIEAGADFIECDIVPTKDCKLICRHEPDLTLTTDADEKFGDRKRTLNIDGTDVTGIFSFDLTLEEVKTLRAKQQMAIRDPSYNGMYEVPTFQEYVAIAQNASRAVGIYPETKHPSFHDSLQLSCFGGRSFTDVVLEELAAAGYTGALDSAAWRKRPAFLQSFERANLIAAAQKTQLPLIFLTDEFDLPIPYEGGTTYGEVLASDAELAKLYEEGIRGIGPWKNTLVAFTEDNHLDTSTIPAGKELVKRIHDAGMQVHIYTLRNEPIRPDGSGYLAYNYKSDATNEYELFYQEIGIDGAFTDFVTTLVPWLERNGL